MDGEGQEIVKGDDMTDISKKVMKQIREEHLEMKPKLYFLVGSILLGVGLAGTAVFGIIFSNLAFHRFRMYGFMARPFPFVHLGLAFAFVVLGIYLLKKYEFSHKRSLIGLVITVVTTVLVLGFLLLQQAVQPWS